MNEGMNEMKIQDMTKKECSFGSFCFSLECEVSTKSNQNNMTKPRGTFPRIKGVALRVIFFEEEANKIYSLLFCLEIMGAFLILTLIGESVSLEANFETDCLRDERTELVGEDIVNIR